MLCSGALVSRTTYAALFAVIGTVYGEGDGSTTFALPNLTDRFIQGSASVGTVKSAGLPNITGHADLMMATNATFSGAFYWASGLSDAKAQSGNGLRFDASRSNSIYGASNTVQPPALTMRYYIKY